MKTIAKNKIATFDYDIVETLDAGIVLWGFEVKSIKTQWCNISSSVIRLNWKSFDIINMDVPLYKKTSIRQIWSYNPKRQRQLLLKKKEITKLFWKTTKTWLSIFPLEVFETKNKIKVKIAVWKLRKKYQKKQVLKERDMDKQAKKQIKDMWL